MSKSKARINSPEFPRWYSEYSLNLGWDRYMKDKICLPRFDFIPQISSPIYALLTILVPKLFLTTSSQEQSQRPISSSLCVRGGELILSSLAFDYKLHHLTNISIFTTTTLTTNQNAATLQATPMETFPLIPHSTESFKSISPKAICSIPDSG
ncbi:hypothetical protein NPIL_496841 [Nephila pilipes]|uniref:Uncharacterized protein n=1 Tax=Nephila pilipes TaxID=299642 RepID=A0A8X6NYA3_NEPPI|nr:hypothetical protein NPIL_496841 [Nephila pilipes]